MPSSMIKTCLLGAVAAVLAFQAPAQAQKSVNLTVIDGYPPKASWVREFIKFYIPEVDKTLAAKGNFKINWNQAWSGQIVKTRHVLEGMSKGLGDIGIVTTVFHADKVPLQQIAYVTPFVSHDPVLVSKTMDALAAKYSAFKDDFKPYNQVYLTNGCVLDSYQMFTKTKVTGLAGFKGMKIHGAGTNLRYLKGLGAAGVAGSLVHIYNNLKTGVVDGTMLWAEAIVRFKIVEVAPYMLRADIGAMCSKVITANAKSWKKMPGEVRAAIMSVAPRYRDHLAGVALKGAAKSLASFQKKGGVISKLPAAERAGWANSMENIAKQWAAKLEKRGVPAREILTAYMDTMRAAKQPIVRHWDRE